MEGFTIRKTGALHQLRTAVGCVFQSHSMKEVERYARSCGDYPCFGSPSLGDVTYVDDNIRAVKYGRLRARP